MADLGAWTVGFLGALAPTPPGTGGGDDVLPTSADPNGGLLLAGDLALAPSDPTVHGAVTFDGGGMTATVRWGPKPLASVGRVFGVGVDLLHRSLVVTDGASRFGSGNISAQWFDKDGTSLTGEFVLLDGSGIKHSITFFDACPSWSAVNVTAGASYGPKCLAFEAAAGKPSGLVLVWTPGLGRGDYNIKLS